MLSTYLGFVTYRRFFPFFSFCTIAGLAEDGKGAVYKYDAVGSYDRVMAACLGKGEKMIQPLLDEITCLEEDDDLWLLSANEDAFTSPSKVITLNSEEAVQLVLRAFRAAAEREISIGDGLDIWIISKAQGYDSSLPETRKLHFALPRH